MRFSLFLAARFFLFAAAFFGAFFAPAIMTAQASILPGTPPNTAYRSDPKFISALAEAQQLSRRHSFAFAIDNYKKANKITGGACEECLEGLYDAQSRTGDYKGAVSTATALENSGEDAFVKVQGYRSSWSRPVSPSWIEAQTGATGGSARGVATGSGPGC